METFAEPEGRDTFLRLLLLCRDFLPSGGLGSTELVKGMSRL